MFTTKVQKENKEPEALQRPARGVSGTMDSACTQGAEADPSKHQGPPGTWEALYLGQLQPSLPAGHSSHPLDPLEALPLDHHLRAGITI